MVIRLLLKVEMTTHTLFHLIQQTSNLQEEYSVSYFRKPTFVSTETLHLGMQMKKRNV